MRQSPQLTSHPLMVSQTAPAGVDRGVRDLDSASRSPHGRDLAERQTTRTVSAGQHHREVPARHLDRHSSKAARAGGRGTSRAGERRSLRIVSIDTSADPGSRRRLDAQPDVEYAQARYRVYPRFTPNDPQYARQWNFPAIEMERRGTSIKVHSLR